MRAHAGRGDPHLHAVCTNPWTDPEWPSATIYKFDGWRYLFVFLARSDHRAIPGAWYSHLAFVMVLSG